MASASASTAPWIPQNSRRPPSPCTRWTGPRGSFGARACGPYRDGRRSRTTLSTVSFIRRSCGGSWRPPASRSLACMTTASSETPLSPVIPPPRGTRVAWAAGSSTRSRLGAEGRHGERRHSPAIRVRHDLRRVRDLRGHAGKPRARVGMVAGHRAAGPERAPAHVVRAAPAQHRADRGDPVARPATRRPGEDLGDFGGVVVGLPPRRAHARASRGGGGARTADLHARRAHVGPGPPRRSGGVAQRGHRERVPARAERPDVSVRPRRRLLHARLPVPLSLHRDARDLSQGASLHRHATAAPGRDEPGGDVGPLHAGLGRPPAGAVLPAVGIGHHRRDPVCPPRADRDRVARPGPAAPLLIKGRVLMLMRTLGRTGLRVAALCLGGNTFGWTTDQAASEAVLDAYLEAGGNFIDTADVYSRWAPGNKGGESETVLGKWMTARKNRPTVLMATKVMGPMGPGPNDTGLSRQHIMEGVEASLRRLQTDYIDLYQAHWDDRETPLEETLRAFDDLVSQGKVRYIGCSNYHAWRLTRALWESDKRGYVRYECLQPKYNLVFRDEYERELEPLCREQGVGVIPYSSLGSGFLSGKYRPGASLPSTARAVGVQKGYMNDRGFTVLAAVDKAAGKVGATTAQVALSWLAH